MAQSRSYSNMPGSFQYSYLDQTATQKVCGAHSHIFQPPRTPSTSASSSQYLTQSMTSTDRPSLSAAGRKRSRVDDYDSRNTPREDWLERDALEGEDAMSPMPFVNTRYAIKGGLDTPTLRAAQLHESHEDYTDRSFRRGLDSNSDGVATTSSYQSFLPLDLEHESNGRGRRTSSKSFNDSSEGWSRTALGLVGGVVGKVWDFCKASAFRGFQAGGGKAYEVHQKPDSSYFTLNINENGWESEKTPYENEGTPLPGQFPDDDLIENYMDNPTPEASPERPGKRRQISSNGDELSRNWIMVPPTMDSQTPLKPQVRGNSRYSIPTASSASRRGSSRPTSRASLNPRRPPLTRGSHAGSPALQSSRPASFASPRSPASSKIPRAILTGSPVRQNSDIKVASPAAREAARWAAVKRKEEREADSTMRRFDAQIKALIREGKEALGTKVEVEDEEPDF